MDSGHKMLLLEYSENYDCIRILVMSTEKKIGKESHWMLVASKGQLCVAKRKP
jgi:hypothetical protein